ncbi:MAG TPA: ABC transporter ATP-binding protein [Armatimonadota bacterium]|nr:ABC transporter ATP-binding protein [Armatimonadota bacterium]
MSAPVTDAIVVRAENLSKVYQAGEVAVPALNDVSLTIRRGEFVAVVGSSGSGKTTLLNIIGCVDVPTCGRYVLDGQEVSRLGDMRLSRLRNEKIGFVFQTFNLLPRLSALENVALPLFYSRRRLARSAPREALQRVGLAHRARHRPAQLSGGEQQRVAIARALVTQPSLILADEPTGNLDTRTGQEIMAVLQGLNREAVTIVMVTHEPVIAAHTGREIRLQDGRITMDHRIEKPVVAEQALAEMTAGARE